MICAAILLSVLVFCAGCGSISPAPALSPVPALSPAPSFSPPPAATHDPAPAAVPFDFLDETGDTIRTRFLLPEGYVRTAGNDYEEYIRDLKLLPHGSPILQYDGKISPLNGWQAAVLRIDVGERDLQQCADAALRLRCEYLFSSSQYDRINYHLTNGDPFSYAEYREGYRLQVNGNRTKMVKTADYDDSYAAFRKYLDVLFSYASTRSLRSESTPVPLDEMRVGDIFVVSGKPVGHCVIVMDLCENEAGEKAFLIGQSSMPAQQIHIIRDPATSNPWLYAKDISFPYALAGWEFDEESLRRMP